MYHHLISSRAFHTLLFILYEHNHNEWPMAGYTAPGPGGGGGGRPGYDNYEIHEFISATTSICTYDNDTPVKIVKQKLHFPNLKISK